MHNLQNMDISMVVHTQSTVSRRQKSLRQNVRQSHTIVQSRHLAFGFVLCIMALTGCEGMSVQSTCASCAALANCTDFGNSSVGCECFYGHVGDGTSCEADECVLKTHDCDENAACSKTSGSFSCSCKIGFVQNESMVNGTNGSCSEIDECTTLSHACVRPNFICTNTIGSYTCSSPCTQCSGNASCYHIVTVVDASANETFVPGQTECGGNTKYLQDIGPYEMRETVHPSVWNDTTSLNESYRCICNLGYEGTGCSCTDINECDTTSAYFSQCPNGTDCMNTPGSFFCGCKAGYANDTETGICTMCPAGKFKPFTGNGTCSDCDQFGNGSTSLEDGSAKCLCGPGQNFVAADGICSACPRGKYNDQLSFDCTECPTGTYQVNLCPPE
jgi:hypothetical protein